MVLAGAVIETVLVKDPPSDVPPVMHTLFPGITRDQFMARHCSNHIQVAYAPDSARAYEALVAKAAMFQATGITTYFCGEVPFAPGAT